MPLTEQEYSDMRNGRTTEKAVRDTHEKEDAENIIKNMSTKNFLIGRTREYIKVPITSESGTHEIEIRARLSKNEMKVHKPFMDAFLKALKGEENTLTDMDGEIAAFLAAITRDNELDVTFWSSGDIDEQTASEILYAYYTEPARRLADVRKFRE